MATVTLSEVLATVGSLPSAEQEALAAWLVDQLASDVHVTVDAVFDVHERRGPMVVGTVNVGTIEMGDLLLLDMPGGVAAVTVVGIEQFRKSIKVAGPGMSAGLELLGVTAAAAKGSQRLRGLGVRA